MKKIFMLICFILFAAVLHAEILGVQNDSGAAFYQGTTKVASWTFGFNGTIETEGTTINGAVKVFFGDKDKRRFVVYAIKENKIQDNVYTWVYKSGEPAGVETYNNGNRDGAFKFLYKSGKTSKEGTYKNGRKDGTIKLYYETGKLAEEGNYKDGMKNGEFTLYYPTGEAKERFTCVNDRRHGQYQQFYQSGTIKMEGQYKNGIKEGNFMKYFESGEDAGIQVYKNGVLISGDSDAEGDIVVTTPLE